MVIISDFSKTFTRFDMPTTWSAFAKSGLLGDAYNTDREALYSQYFEYEKFANTQKTEEWFMKHAELFVKYQLTHEQIDSIVMNDAYFAPRDGVEDFIQQLQIKDIPLYIVSSGITNLIERWFQLRFNYIPDIIIANNLIVDKGVAVGVDTESIISPLDKSIEIEFEHGNQDIVLIGDNIEDTKVVLNPTKTIGLTDENLGFDVKLGKEASMMDIFNVL